MTANTTNFATAAQTILALDLGKYKSVAGIYRSADDQQFTTITTSRPELIRLLAKHRPAVVLIEAACCVVGSGTNKAGSQRAGGPGDEPGGFDLDSLFGVPMHRDNPAKEKSDADRRESSTRSEIQCFR